MKVRSRGHVTWRYESNLGYWKLTSDQEALLHVFGFQYIDQIRFLRHDRDLILSLVERWWPGRNTFQLPFAEMTIVLADVANILGLPITGEPIIFDESFSPETVIMEYLGVETPKLYDKSLVTYTWLRHNFMHLDRIGDEEISIDEDRVSITFNISVIIV
ncbi:serine/threonine-protein phosphatase 7 long form-like protein [Iris pallida]|uniref:Serine/threonine-protein phosphatase 7 long form-like protein n=1 Tax=Iris pallida TaxID=29817 RepID=A0AAX6I485_IRIPA|nr:serine/threonine-protein phosphatase 7 long form-like protein [Iris pallida]